MSLSLTYGSPEASCNNRADTYFGRGSAGLIKEFWTLCILLMLEEDLRRGPRLGAFVVLVVFEDGVTNGGTALFKTLEAFSRGAFFFSTSMELKTKGAGGGGAGREIIDSNTSLPAILTARHFLAVSKICFDRSDFACTCFSGRFMVHNCG